MSRPGDTNRDWPPELVPGAAPPPLLLLLYLARARIYLGQHEDAACPNTGTIVERMMRPWRNKAPDCSGWALWCAAFVSTCVLEVLEAEAPQLVDEWHKIGTAGCDALWARCMERGWARRESAQLRAGSLIFFGVDRDLKHVGFIEVIEGVSGRLVKTIEGNHHNAVARGKYLLTDPSIYGFVELPW